MRIKSIQSVVIVFLIVLSCNYPTNNQDNFCLQNQNQNIMVETMEEQQSNQTLLEQKQLIKSSSDPVLGVYTIIINNNSDCEKYTETISGDGTIDNPYVFTNNYKNSDSIFVRNLTEGNDNFVFLNSTFKRFTVYNRNTTIENSNLNLYNTLSITGDYVSLYNNTINENSILVTLKSHNYNLNIQMLENNFSTANIVLSAESSISGRIDHNIIYRLEVHKLSFVVITDNWFVNMILDDLDNLYSIENNYNYYENYLDYFPEGEALDNGWFPKANYDWFTLTANPILRTPKIPNLIGKVVRNNTNDLNPDKYVWRSPNLDGSVGKTFYRDSRWAVKERIEYIKLSWDLSNTTDLYRIYLNDDLVGTTDKSSYDYYLTPEERSDKDILIFVFRVTGVNGSGASDFSRKYFVRMMVVVGEQGINDQTNQLLIYWTIPACIALGFTIWVVKLYRKINKINKGGHE